jgi:hypothetical protein
MEGSDQPSLTEFLLDLSESEELYKRFWEDREPLILARGLERYRDLLGKKEIDVQELRDAVRTEVTGRSGHQAPGPDGEDLEECVIYGIRRPPAPPPQ